MIVADVVTRAGAPRLVVVLGTGLIGKAIVDELVRRCAPVISTHPVDWHDRDVRAMQLQHLTMMCRDAVERGREVCFVWSAGLAGFMASEEEARAELPAYRDVMNVAKGLASTPASVSFHLISSAGGLFEGQRHVTDAATPLPRRAYGRLKLMQEQLLLESGPFTARRVYRVTSVYGHIRQHVRAGLVSTLLINGAWQRLTRITGRMDTLRDFVFVADVAAYVIDGVLDARAGDAVACLARGRPASLFEVQKTVEAVVGRKLHVQYSVDTANGEDITFSPTGHPPGWAPSDLRWNVGAIYVAALAAGTLMPPHGHG